jgi:hypothetical protein
MDPFCSINEFLIGSLQFRVDFVFYNLNSLLNTFWQQQHFYHFWRNKPTTLKIKFGKFKIGFKMKLFFLMAGLILLLLNVCSGILIRYGKQEVITQSWVTSNIQQNVQ